VIRARARTNSAIMPTLPVKASAMRISGRGSVQRQDSNNEHSEQSFHIPKILSQRNQFNDFGKKASMLRMFDCVTFSRFIGNLSAYICSSTKFPSFFLVRDKFIFAVFTDLIKHH
jgi:hypothetical protein